MAGGDNLFAQLTDVNQFLEDFFNYPKGNYHFSVGIAEKAVLAYLALKVAKTSAISGAIIRGSEGKEGIFFSEYNDFKKTNSIPLGKLFICNAFSINMLTESNGTEIELKFVPLSLEQAKNAIHEEKNREIVNAIGHEDTSRRVCQSLEIDYQVNRGNVSLSSEDVVIVAQYTGERLPIGSTELPDGADINYWKVLRESD